MGVHLTDGNGEYLIEVKILSNLYGDILYFVGFIVNRKLWNDVQMVLGEYLANFKTDGTFMYSKEANKGQGGYVKVGATFDSYTFGGNTISFAVDRALTREYPDKGYGLLIDLTADKTTGTPAIKFSGSREV